MLINLQMPHPMTKRSEQDWQVVVYAGLKGTRHMGAVRACHMTYQLYDNSSLPSFSLTAN